MVGDKAGTEPGADPGSCHTGHGQRGSDARPGVKPDGSGTHWPLGSPRGHWGQDCPLELSWGGKGQLQAEGETVGAVEPVLFPGKRARLPRFCGLPGPVAPGGPGSVTRPD